MKKIPEAVDNHISNAKYYRDAASKHPEPTCNAIFILLLITGWENITIAEHLLSAWANETKIDPKIHKSHALKLNKVPKVTRRVLNSSGISPSVVEYVTGDDFKKLRELCLFGSGAESSNLENIFRTGWRLDGLRVGLNQKIRWIETILRAYNDLLKKPID